MSQELDNDVLSMMDVFIDESDDIAARLTHRLWKDRQALVDAMRTVVNWDLMSSEAFSIERARQIAEDALKAVGEGS